MQHIWNRSYAPPTLYPGFPQFFIGFPSSKCWIRCCGDVIVIVDMQEVNRRGNKFKWPSLDDVIDYRRRVRRLVCDVIDRCDIQLPVTIDSQLVSCWMQTWTVVRQSVCRTCNQCRNSWTDHQSFSPVKYSHIISPRGVGAQFLMLLF